MRFYRNEAIELIARRRLDELERSLGHELAPPIPVDLLAEKILGLNILWEEIEELPGEIIFGAIQPKERLIILNERRRVEFTEKPGLERSTKGHEMGHWDLFLRKGAVDHPELLAAEQRTIAFRSSGAGNVAVLQILESCQVGRELLAQMRTRADEPDEARAVNRYAAAISMPKALICREAEKIDRTEWRNLYALAKKFDVTISALTVRLKQFNLLRVTDDGKLFDSEDAANGQMRLGY